MLPARAYHWCVFGLEGAVIWQGPYGGLQMEETEMNHDYKFRKIHLSLMGANNTCSENSRQISDDRLCETQQSLSLPTSSSCYIQQQSLFVPSVFDSIVTTFWNLHKRRVDAFPSLSLPFCVYNTKHFYFQCIYWEKGLPTVIAHVHLPWSVGPHGKVVLLHGKMSPTPRNKCMFS